MDGQVLKFTYIGGPTALLELGGVRLLTDPTFDPGGTVYELGAYTLRKTTGPAVGVGEVGPVDVVLLSHDHHMDNLDRAGRGMLAGAGVVLTTVEGAGRLGGGNVRGMTAWEEVDVPAGGGRTLRVVATPARHGPGGGGPGAGGGVRAVLYGPAGGGGVGVGGYGVVRGGGGGGAAVPGGEGGRAVHGGGCGAGGRAGPPDADGGGGAGDRGSV